MNSIIRGTSINMLKFITLLVILAVVGADPLRSKLDGRIIGGEDTTIEEVPHQVSFQIFGGHHCGGSIISKNWFVTAAHCTDFPPHYYSVRSGSNVHDNGGLIHKIAEIIRHKGYGGDLHGHLINDIALIRVVEPFVLDETREVIKLFEMGEVATPGEMATITGWGRTSDGSPDILQTAQVPIISKKDCYEAYKLKGGIPEGEICAAYPEGGKDSCQGDSGGPLTIGGRLAGIVSWGYGCAKAGNPGVYTEIASYRAWIREKSGV